MPGRRLALVVVGLVDPSIRSIAVAVTTQIIAAGAAFSVDLPPHAVAVMVLARPR